MKRYFCTYFDENFVPRGLALYDSLTKNSEDFLLIVLALDDKVFDEFSVYKNIQVLKMQDYLNRWQVDVNKYSTKKELYFSLTAGYCLYVLEQFPEIDILFYLDADIFFFDSVEHLFKEMGNKSIYITPHKVFPLLQLAMKYHGAYNVGINGFRNDKIGIDCLNAWKNDCDSWSGSNSENSTSYFSDQIYLDKWPEKFEGVCISKNPAINLAPWSIGQYNVSNKNGHFYINDKSVVAFHFSDLKRVAEGKWETNSGPHLFFMGLNKKKLYLTYLKTLEKYYAERNIKKYLSLNHGRSSLKSKVRTLFNYLTRSLITIK